MKIVLKALVILIIQTTVLSAQTPLERYGKLKLVGIQLSAENGSPVQLKGMSSHGIQWTSDCLEQSTFDTLRNDWEADVFRIAVYVEEGGYITDSTFYKELVDTLIERVTKSGLYCVLDWHILSDGNPMKNIAHAKRFWKYMSKRHGSKKNMIYEICNEPNGTRVTWDTIKKYAETIIPIIRSNDSSSVIVVGTPTWSGQPWNIIGKELQGDIAKNVMYTFHFYSATHSNYLPSIKEAVTKIPIFATEWGGVLSSGKGQFDVPVTDRFMDIFNGDNPSGTMISWCNWSYSDVDEGSSVLKPYSCNSASWNNTSSTGDIVKELIKTPDLDPLCVNKPKIFQHPRNIVSKIGRATYFIARSTCPNVNYQWQYSMDSANWSNLIGKNSYMLSLDPIRQEDKGFYRAMIIFTDDTLITKPAYLKLIMDGPFLGYPFPVPGRIEAEFYDEGDKDVTFSDTDPGNNGSALRLGDVDIEITQDSIGGYNVGWTADYEFLAFTIDVEEAGFYDIFFRVASNATSPGELVILMNNVDHLIPGLVVGPTGGWQKWKTLRVSNLSFAKGIQNLKLYFLEGDVNVNYMDILPYDPTGLDKEILTESFSIYPNPGTENITIKSNSLGFKPKSLEIFNTLGDTVYQKEMTQEEIKLSLSSLKSGIYTIKISGDSYSENLKWIKR